MPLTVIYHCKFSKELVLLRRDMILHLFTCIISFIVFFCSMVHKVDNMCYFLCSVACLLPFLII